MIVTHVIPYMHPDAGGPPVVVDRLCRRLAARGWESRVLTTDTFARGRDTTWATPPDKAYPVEVYQTWGPRTFSYSPCFARAVGRAVAGSDLVHLHTLWTYPTFRAGRECRRQGVPFVVMPHGMLDPHSLGRKRVKKMLYGRLVEWPNLRSAAGVLYTHAEEQRLAESMVLGLPPGHITPLGSDAPPPDPRAILAAEFAAQYPSLGGKDLVLFLGRIHSKKGLDLLLPAFAEVARVQPLAHLLLVGPGDQGDLRRLRETLSAWRLTDRATLAGPLYGREKWAAMAASRCFVLPSYQENFALAVVESLAMGLPVVISRRVNIWPEVTRAGAGLTCDLSAPSVRDGILTWLRDPQLAADAGHKGRELVKGTFTWDRTAEAVESAYRQVLGSHLPQASPTLLPHAKA